MGRLANAFADPDALTIRRLGLIPAPGLPAQEIGKTVKSLRDAGTVAEAFADPDALTIRRLGLILVPGLLAQEIGETVKSLRDMEKVAEAFADLDASPKFSPSLFRAPWRATVPEQM